MLYGLLFKLWLEILSAYVMLLIYYASILSYKVKTILAMLFFCFVFFKKSKYLKKDLRFFLLLLNFKYIFLLYLLCMFLKGQDKKMSTQSEFSRRLTLKIDVSHLSCLIFFQVVETFAKDFSEGQLLPIKIIFSA